jgi:hypothetical protein
VDDGLSKTGGIVLDADGLRGLVEAQFTDAVDLAQIGDGECGGLGGRDTIAVQDIKLGHALMIAVGPSYDDPVAGGQLRCDLPCDGGYELIVDDFRIG